MAKHKHKTDAELTAEQDRRSRAAAAERARELERAGHFGLARAFRAYADGRTDGRSLTLTDYLDPPDVAAANAARAEHALASAATQLPGFTPAAHPAPDAVAGQPVPDADAAAAVPDADADPDA